MTSIMLIFITALFFASVGTPVIRKIAVKSGFVASPKSDRAHTEPTHTVQRILPSAVACGGRDGDAFHRARVHVADRGARK